MLGAPGFRGGATRKLWGWRKSMTLGQVGQEERNEQLISEGRRQKVKQGPAVGGCRLGSSASGSGTG